MKDRPKTSTARRLAVGIGATLLGGVAWAALVVAATFGGWFHASLAPDGDTRGFMDAAIEQIESDSPGNISFVLIEDGQVFDQYASSIGEHVDGDTQFQVASLSKWITAVGVMSMVDRGLIDLDAPVADYLTRWQLPAGGFDNAGVTVRRLLSHTSGLTDGLGFA